MEVFPIWNKQRMPSRFWNNNQWRSSQFDLDVEKRFGLDIEKRKQHVFLEN